MTIFSQTTYSNDSLYVHATHTYVCIDALNVYLEIHTGSRFYVLQHLLFPSILLYPHKVLSRQFLTPQMDKKYRQLDYDLRQKSANLLADRLCHRHDELASLLSGSLTKDNFTSMHNMFQNTKELTFMEHVSSIYILRMHLRHLSGYDFFQ